MVWRQIFWKKMKKPIFLIIGLGNPGREFECNRHNIGFRAIDYLGNKWNIPLDNLRNNALNGQKLFRAHRIILSKPLTFMNQSGSSVAGLVRFYKVPLDHLFIIYDDLDLPLGTLRLRSSGGSAGHKGMTSIIQQIGSNNFPRIRLGIGRPNGKMNVTKFVLQDFSEKEEEILNLVFDRVYAALHSAIEHGVNQAMTQFNSSVL